MIEIKVGDQWNFSHSRHVLYMYGNDQQVQNNSMSFQWNTVISYALSMTVTVNDF